MSQLLAVSVWSRPHPPPPTTHHTHTHLGAGGIGAGNANVQAIRALPPQQQLLMVTVGKLLGELFVWVCASSACSMPGWPALSLRWPQRASCWVSARLSWFMHGACGMLGCTCPLTHRPCGVCRGRGLPETCLAAWMSTPLRACPFPRAGESLNSHGVRLRPPAPLAAPGSSRKAGGGTAAASRARAAFMSPTNSASSRKRWGGPQGACWQREMARRRVVCGEGLACIAPSPRFNSLLAGGRDQAGGSHGRACNRCSRPNRPCFCRLGQGSPAVDSSHPSVFTRLIFPARALLLPAAHSPAARAAS